MRIYKIRTGAVVEHKDQFFGLEVADWDVFLNRKNLYRAVLNELVGLTEVDDVNLNKVEIPMGTQEIWASGVTYMRSKEARMEESKDAGGGTFYDRVYDADRPELFFKSTFSRTVGHNGTVRIRKDSGWDVPEPELTLLISSEGTIEGYTIGNDMSSRSIEGENPLYLPQAKTYEGCAALGPCIYVSENPIDPNTQITLEINRKGKIEGLKIAICGDILHSRVARSNIYLMNMLGAEVNVIAPKTLMPKSIERLGVKSFTDMKKGLDGCDIVMMLRLQNERMQGSFLPSKREYYEFYGLTLEKLKFASKEALIMHPGPMNRGVEIDTKLADDINVSLVKEQVELGVAVRMACLKIYCKK